MIKYSPKKVFCKNKSILKTPIIKRIATPEENKSLKLKSYKSNISNNQIKKSNNILSTSKILSKSIEKTSKVNLFTKLKDKKSLGLNKTSNRKIDDVSEISRMPKIKCADFNTNIHSYSSTNNLNESGHISSDISETYVLHKQPSQTLKKLVNNTHKNNISRCYDKINNLPDSIQYLDLTSEILPTKKVKHSHSIDQNIKIHPILENIEHISSSCSSQLSDSMILHDESSISKENLLIDESIIVTNKDINADEPKRSLNSDDIISLSTTQDISDENSTPSLSQEVNESDMKPDEKIFESITKYIQSTLDASEIANNFCASTLDQSIFDPTRKLLDNHEIDNKLLEEEEEISDTMNFTDSFSEFRPNITVNLSPIKNRDRTPKKIKPVRLNTYKYSFLIKYFYS